MLDMAKHTPVNNPSQLADYILIRTNTLMLFTDHMIPQNKNYLCCMINTTKYSLFQLFISPELFIVFLQMTQSISFAVNLINSAGAVITPSLPVTVFLNDVNDNRPIWRNPISTLPFSEVSKIKIDILPLSERPLSEVLSCYYSRIHKLGRSSTL